MKHAQALKIHSDAHREYLRTLQAEYEDESREDPESRRVDLPACFGAWRAGPLDLSDIALLLRRSGSS